MERKRKKEAYPTRRSERLLKKRIQKGYVQDLYTLQVATEAHAKELPLILSLPTEIFEKFVACVDDIRTLLRFGQTCKLAYYMLKDRKIKSIAGCIRYGLTESEYSFMSEDRDPDIVQEIRLKIIHTRFDSSRYELLDLTLHPLCPLHALVKILRRRINEPVRNLTVQPIEAMSLVPKCPGTALLIPMEPPSTMVRPLAMCIAGSAYRDYYTIGVHVEMGKEGVAGEFTLQAKLTRLLRYVDTYPNIDVELLCGFASAEAMEDYVKKFSLCQSSDEEFE